MFSAYAEMEGVQVLVYRNIAEAEECLKAFAAV